MGPLKLSSLIENASLDVLMQVFNGQEEVLDGLIRIPDGLMQPDVGPPIGLMQVPNLLILLPECWCRAKKLACHKS